MPLAGISTRGRPSEWLRQTLRLVVFVLWLRPRLKSKWLNSVKGRRSDSLKKQMRMQSNMESIAAKAIPHLSDDAQPDRIEDDWISNFFDKSRIVSDDQMQELWAKVLAGEGNNPGRFSRKTVSILAELDKRDAELFKSLCRFAWTVSGTVEVFLFDEQGEPYNREGINFNSIGRLEALGLVRYNGTGNFQLLRLPKTVLATYGLNRLILSFPDESGNRLDVGKLLLTQSGMELFRISEASVVAGFSNTSTIVGRISR